ncbi:ParB/RepB/Spo0J family partition protein [Amphritea balenae]|uniref:Probable chromosome-partitioning protein ParB n=1 Tax=Amphritea balenae TaxID=452629 RepID=A0A3P1SNV0_9GAMM|nr:ParB/RepB/Spo0J family partition protein [Amphritea balenae]RRC98836.1 ParB/RepB/Spo0J family partition protein [Amphritea balenae]GGK62196.1 chromosome partitioning protein [Amphritea balenae]
MAAKKRGLGRGLDALLSTTTNFEEETVAKATSEGGDGYRMMPIDQVQRGKYQPRRDLEPQALQELANSIKAQGVMQPIVIRPVSDNLYEIIAGERRWRASQMAGLDEIPAVIKDVPDEAAIAMALIENIQRENLNSMEEAIALDRLKTEFELTQQEVADAVGKSRSAITNLLRLMNLTDDVKRMLEYGDLEMGHARALLGMEGEEQVSAAKEVIGKNLSVRQTEDLVRKLQQKKNEPPKTPKQPDPLLKDMSETLSSRLNSKVSISENAAGKGKITIAYENREKFEAILKAIQ